MGEVTTASIRHEPDEEHILRRLGGAVIVHWAGLPEAMRDVLVNQASVMSDREAAVDLRQTIEAFIAKHAGGMTDPEESTEPP